MIRGAVVGLIFVGGAVFAAAPEWGQWAGPNRNFHVPGRPFAQMWPPGGPRVVWKRPLPFGSSSVAVDHHRLYTMYRDGDNEVILALEAATGKTVWEYKYPAVFLKGMNMNTGPGPHSTPLVDGDRLYTAGVTGKASLSE
jgi:outer membrane protein assembly factor BamB